MAYCASSDVKEYLGVPDSDSNDDTLIGNCITRAQAIIDTETRRTFEAASGTASSDYTARYFSLYEDIDDDGWLVLDKDLAVLLSVDVGDGDTQTSDLGVWVTNPKNETPIEAIKLRDSSALAWTYTCDAEDDIIVTGKWAYSVTAPADIVHACVRLSSWLYRQKEAGPDLDRPVITADGSVIMPSKLPADVAQICLRYRKHKIGSI